jgi:hypothetical protein
VAETANKPVARGKYQEPAVFGNRLSVFFGHDPGTVAGEENITTASRAGLFTSSLPTGIAQSHLVCIQHHGTERTRTVKFLFFYAG